LGRDELNLTELRKTDGINGRGGELFSGWPGLLVVRAAKPQEAAGDIKLSNPRRFMRSAVEGSASGPYPNFTSRVLLSWRLSVVVAKVIDG